MITAINNFSIPSEVLTKTMSILEGVMSILEGVNLPHVFGGGKKANVALLSNSSLIEPRNFRK